MSKGLTYHTHQSARVGDEFSQNYTSKRVFYGKNKANFSFSCRLSFFRMSPDAKNFWILIGDCPGVSGQSISSGNTQCLVEMHVLFKIFKI